MPRELRLLTGTGPLGGQLKLLVRARDMMVGMTTEIRVLDAEDDLIAAANVFRTAMVGFHRCPISHPADHHAARSRPYIGAFVGGIRRHRRCRDDTLTLPAA